MKIEMEQNDPFLKDLNDKQREAVTTTEGPLLILAGPGAGKTKTLTYRIAHLIRIGIPAEQILAVTFTNKAAREMKDRICSLLASRIGSRSYAPPVMPFIGTFHAFALQLLRHHATLIGYLPSFSIFDDEDSLSVVKESLKELEINPKQFSPTMLANAISNCKSELLSPEQYAEKEDIRDLFPRILHRVYTAYQHKLKEANAMDFDDLLGQTVILFKNHPEVLAQYQDRLRYIHVDEYQDTNHAQYTLMRMIAQKYNNIAVVGDDAQAIYSFRGADFRNILNFEKDWPQAHIVVLDQNYRSTQVILDAATHLIAANMLQKNKKLRTERPGGEKIVLTPVENERAEAEYALSTMQQLIREGITLKDMVVLYRTNAQSRQLEEVFLENNFPYKITGGIKFYQRKEVKDIIAYLRCLINPGDTISTSRIINVPPRGIGKQGVSAFLAKQQELVTRKASLEAIQKFKTILENLRSRIQKESATAFLKHLVVAINYQGYLNETANNADERWENVEELVSLAKKYDELPPPTGITKLLEDVALMSDHEEDEPQTNLINLMTVHAAKGLEFPVVFVVGLEEGVFPHSRALFQPGDLEEERRLCYVALTRAKERLFLSFALSRTHFGSTQMNPPSRFIREIPEELLDVREEGLNEMLLD